MYKVSILNYGSTENQVTVDGFVKALRIAREHERFSPVCVSIVDARMTRYGKKRFPAISAAEIGGPERNSYLGLESYLP